MDRKPTISVIIPVYNVEKYIRRCVESVLSQTFKDFELLLVDDGSPDHSGEICDEYAQKDPRVHVFHKSNGGASTARNCGLDHSQGDYISFVDADDYVEPTYLGDMLGAMTRCGADMVCCGAWFLERTDGRCHSLRITDRTKEYTRNEALMEIYSMDSYGTWLWNKLFKATIIRDNGISFHCELRHAEDSVFVNDCLMHCSKVVYISEKLYHYADNGSSTTHTTVTNGRFDYRYLDVLRGSEMMYNTVRTLHNKAVMGAAKGYMFIMNKYVADSFLPSRDSNDTKTRHLLRRNLIKYLPHYLGHPRLLKAMGRKDTLRMLFHVCFPSLYKRIYKK